MTRFECFECAARQEDSPCFICGGSCEELPREGESSGGEAPADTMEA